VALCSPNAAPAATPSPATAAPSGCWSASPARGLARSRARLSRADVNLGAGAHIHCTGKGRKESATPLTTLTVAVLRGWLAEPLGARTIRCSRPGPASGSAGTLSSIGSASISRPPAWPVRRRAASTSACTPCGTPQLCDCSSRARISR